jgi:hypothetical protein
MKSVDTRCSDGMRHYSVVDGALHIESISGKGKKELLEKIPLTRLSDEYGMHRSGSYLTKTVMFIAVCPMSLLILFPVLSTSGHIETIYFFSTFGVWFFSWAVFGARIDVNFGIRSRDGKDVVQVRGNGKDQDKLNAFVREVVEQVRQLNSQQGKSHLN